MTLVNSISHRALTATALSLLLAPLPARAQAVGKSGATVERWAVGLAGPQGIVRTSAGEVLIAEHDEGRIARYDTSGKRLGVLADGLKSPSWILLHQGVLFVSERQGNSVARVEGGSITRLAGEVPDPLGLAADPRRPGALLVLSHRLSQVRRFASGPDGTLVLEPAPVLAPEGGMQYGWRDVLATRDGTLYVTDELTRTVLRRPPGGQLAPWARYLGGPSGLALGPDGRVYVTEEVGRVSRLRADGTPEVLAEGLGAARAILFLDRQSLLVTDRKGGAVWKITLPSS